MAEVLLFHHAHGLTAGVRSFADRLRAAGHTVHVPDLYAGATFPELSQGLAHAKEVGFGTVLERGCEPLRICRSSWSTPASRSGSCRPSSWRRRGRAPAVRC
ncbi:hypothetical protein [Blastococcus brunescens]|uniref:Dienelactone hydrolase domain-containing protein n=1 Tax=Blastococcus brunescens TaxID=1564165 RepID=A0ABZ1B7F4_9ACTN|nr:hypothetical protein [Blastococcus sp. BMG 8361]WRL65748.1 hypothetical protein U6N30_09305 [Blastococcus sp. BMG 8361]